MYPYMKQVALWHTLEMMDKDRSDYIFFNDGDNKPDDKKVIGSTGGIYYNPGNKPDSVIRTMYMAMSKGGGGDAPENNIEACLAAQKTGAKYSELIMIADNYSSVKDIELLPLLKVPVRVVVCGMDNGIHPDYLKIAYLTGGSVHTIEEDIMNLSNLHDGDTLTIGGKQYRFEKSNFFLVSKPT